MKKDLDLILSYTELNGECMEWQRCYNSDGYPRACINSNVNAKVHRVVFELVHGKLEEVMVVRHVCDNPKCINPDHLVSGTVLDNVKDRVERKRTRGHVSDAEIEKVKTLRQSGKTYSKIATELGIKYKRVEYILTKLN
jgi:hypothetical protein